LTAQRPHHSRQRASGTVLA